jgi:hypothetical protein
VANHDQDANKYRYYVVNPNESIAGAVSVKSMLLQVLPPKCRFGC